jgi:hypothetical protein
MLSEVKRNGVLEYYLIANKWHGTYEEFGSSAPDTPEQASKQASKQAKDYRYAQLQRFNGDGYVYTVDVAV